MDEFKFMCRQDTLEKQDIKKKKKKKKQDVYWGGSICLNLCQNVS